jgi:hypothetical protein
MKGIQNKSEIGTHESAPDFTLATVQGTRLCLSLSELLNDRCTIVLVFLRHLG